MTYYLEKYIDDGTGETETLSLDECRDTGAVFAALEEHGFVLSNEQRAGVTGKLTTNGGVELMFRNTDPDCDDWPSEQIRFMITQNDLVADDIASERELGA